MPIYPEISGKTAHRTAGIIAAIGSLTFVSGQKIETAIIKNTEEPVIHALKKLGQQHLQALGHRVVRVVSPGSGLPEQGWQPNRRFNTLPAPPPSETYRVHPGDSFWSIARRDHISMVAIAAYNHMKLGGVLPVNKVLRLPPAAWFAAHDPSRGLEDPQLEPVTNSSLAGWLLELRDCESGGNYT